MAVFWQSRSRGASAIAVGAPGRKPANTNCATIAAITPATVYFGPVEVRGYKQATEQIITYPHPAVKLTNGKALNNAQFLHRDHLSSVRAITGSTGAVVERSVYKPFGEQAEWLSASQPAPETKGWIGQRFDADAGLQYLNARYYDPSLGMFLQPDWWEVTKPGVGTNRFSYSFNDPMNFSDPSGHERKPSWGERAVSAIMEAAEKGLKSIGLGKYTERYGANALAHDIVSLVPGSASGWRAEAEYHKGNFGAAAANLAVGMVEVGAAGITGGKTTSVNPGSLRPTPPQVPTLTVSKSQTPAIAANVEAAIAQGAPTKLTRASQAQAQANRAEALKHTPKAPRGLSRDEYPFASTVEGGQNARVANVPVGEQHVQGGVMSQFYSRNNIMPGDCFCVRVGQ